MKKPKEVIIKQDLDKPIATEIIAESIIEISRAMKKIEEGRLTRRALILLIKDQCHSCTFHAIEEVLKALRDLERTYVR